MIIHGIKRFVAIILMKRNSSSEASTRFFKERKRFLGREPKIRKPKELQINLLKPKLKFFFLIIQFISIEVSHLGSHGRKSPLENLVHTMNYRQFFARIGNISDFKQIRISNHIQQSPVFSIMSRSLLSSGIIVRN